MSSDGIFPVGDPEYDAVYAEEAAMIDASELIARALEERGMTKTQLAQALGVSKSEISARLAGERNITVRKLAATLHALDAKLVLGVSTPVDAHAGERDTYSGWKAPQPGPVRQPARASDAASSPYTNWQPKTVAQ